jgi:hypothetical protein
LTRALARTWWNPDDAFKSLEKEMPVDPSIDELEDDFSAKIVAPVALASAATNFVQILDAKRGKNLGRFFFPFPFAASVPYIPSFRSFRPHHPQRYHVAIQIQKNIL